MFREFKRKKANGWVPATLKCWRGSTKKPKPKAPPTTRHRFFFGRGVRDFRYSVRARSSPNSLAHLHLKLFIKKSWVCILNGDKKNFCEQRSKGKNYKKSVRPSEGGHWSRDHGRNNCVLTIFRYKYIREFFKLWYGSRRTRRIEENKILCLN